MSFAKGGAVEAVFGLILYFNVYPILYIFSFIWMQLSKEDLPQKFTQ
jgi:hypothetical protein